MSGESELKVLVAQVAAAYFSNSHVNPSDISQVLSQITASLRGADDGDGRFGGGSFGGERTQGLPAPSLSQAAVHSSEPNAVSVVTPNKPTVAAISRSIQDDGLISFEDGRTYKTLKRHVAAYGLTPAQYREKWGLPQDYPMVCSTSSAKRSALAKQIGLGRKDASLVRKAPPRSRMAKAAQR
jgi:predicted transcriptional regulator